MKRILSLILSALILVLSMTTSFASDFNFEYTEGVSSEEFVEYQEIEEPGTARTQVYAYVASSFEVKIPKIIVLSGKTYKADYQVGVKGDISGKGYIRVVSQPSFWLYDVTGVKDSEKGTNELSAFFVSSNEAVPAGSINNVNPEDYVYANGHMECLTLTAGRWHSEVNFYIDTDVDFNDIDPIASDGTILRLRADDAYIGEGYRGYKDVSAIVDNSIKENVLTATSNSSAVGKTMNKLGLKDGAKLLNNVKNNLSNTEVVYMSDSENIIVDNEGRLSITNEAQAGDTAVITATFPGVVTEEVGEVGREDLTVKFGVTVYRIEASKEEIELEVGTSDVVTASIYPNVGNFEINWDTPLALNDVSFTQSGKTQVSTMTIDVPANASDDNGGLLRAYTEDDCETNIVVNIAANHKHVYTVVSHREPTCLDGGETVYVCNGCDENTEGHSYTEKHLMLEHVCSDGHWCDLCDNLIYPYREGEFIYRNVHGIRTEFICVDPIYVDESGQKGAYFLATQLLTTGVLNAAGGIPFSSSTAHVWSNSTARTYLNTNSDTSRLMLTDTTVKEGHNWSVPYPTLDSINLYNVSTPQPETKDYFFLPSVREAVTYGKYMLNPYGDSRTFSSIYTNWIHKPWYWTRTKLDTNHPSVNFIYEDGNGIGQAAQDGWPKEYHWGLRPACVIKQDADSSYLLKKKYEQGDIIYRTIDGQSVKFVCVTPLYNINHSNAQMATTVDKEYAMFMSVDLLDGSKYLYSKDSNVWATSEIRQVLNGDNSDKTDLVLVNTTQTHEFKKPVYHWGFLFENWEYNDPLGQYLGKSVMPQISETHDYYFIPSINELFVFKAWMLSSNGQIRNMKGFNNKGYFVRNGLMGSKNHVAYVNTLSKEMNIDKTLITNRDIGFRICCVLENE